MIDARPPAGTASECGVGVRRSTRWALPSPDITVSWIARNAGEETDDGVTAPPGPIVNVAGKRTRFAPPAGGGAGGGGDVVVRAGAVELPVEVLVCEVELVLVAGGAVVVAAPVLDATGALEPLVECPEPPHPESRTTAPRLRTRMRRLTVSPS
jgi:hypothetical protein